MRARSNEHDDQPDEAAGDRGQRPEVTPAPRRATADAEREATDARG
jgi:hypothetical protein